MATQNVLPPEIQCYILERLMEPHNDPEGSRISLSPYACVCKRWQFMVEAKTFRHLLLRPSDIQEFARLAHARRRGHIKHILFEIPVNELGVHSPLMIALVTLTDRENDILFTQAVRHLWRVLSSWKNHSITVEIGVISSSFKTDPDRFDEEAPFEPSLLDRWDGERGDFMGRSPLRLDFKEPTATEEQDECHLPNAEVITRLLMCRRYVRHISAKSLSLIFKASPCIQAIHLERRWCWGQAGTKPTWDKDSALLGGELPLSLKHFSFYEEFSTVHHWHPGKPGGLRSNARLLEAVVAASRHLEHLAISLATDARHLFSFSPQPNWEFLKTVALTSSIMASRSSDGANELLWSAAQAAKRMPKLEALEIWHCKGGEGGVFRYEKLDRSKNIIWRSTWSFCLSKSVEQAWRGAVADPDNYLDELGVKVTVLPPGIFARFGNIFSYLELREHILHDLSWMQAK